MAEIQSIEVFCYRFPLKQPVTTSFGTMADRPAVFIRVQDKDAIAGWGEVWCNFPSVGAEYRVRILREIMAPLIVGRSFTNPSDLYEWLSTKMAVLALQCGEPGPFSQVIAGLDIAMWDLCARRAHQPLWRFLGGTQPQIPVYASGINPIGARETVVRALELGHRAFKQKIGFDPKRDCANLAEVRREIGDLFLAADANQAWSVATACERLPEILPFNLGWLEEPVRADVPWAHWRRLIEAGAPPLAGGENLATPEAFEEAVSTGILDVLQPDIAKWGGFTQCAHVARRAMAAGRRYCPHYLGGGIGLLASAHLLAGVGGDGMLEIDINPNPLRDLSCGPIANVHEGHVRLSEEPGLGVAFDLERFAPWRTA